ncbi:DUF1467 family protein [Candidatus Anaplasma sp. TIGMIC]|uniref:DUF1467 family protein n=1 Tax=Candidatus Anaplasma sp. TIGMIC TaxID=3020713 RepID=UPI00233109D0|nr:DUF1467 family protein [Candidatus Anaplasma sp. TIGMIC]MDB1135629.1 DUF1467 family protein [Candidatus Anaplasma sp. TIGMIC]
MAEEPAVIAEALLVFIIIWWVTLFIALPIGVEMYESESTPAGCASSAPKKAYLALKALIVTGIAIVMTGLYCYLKIKGYVDIVFSIMFELAP